MAEGAACLMTAGQGRSELRCLREYNGLVSPGVCKRSVMQLTGKALSTPWMLP